ncbi:DUF968 domain-containing protein [Providencia manganoxydans]|uniref:DUF968 domain-containing protein n=1 Tax=Providencia manganoxydans TaxID=2923283 RepID=UPI0032D9F135
MINSWILTAVPVPDLGVVMFKPGVNQLGGFKGLMQITPATKEFNKSGKITHKQVLLDDKRLIPFFDNSEVLTKAGGIEALKGRLKQSVNYCQIHDENDGYHHHELTITKIGNHYVRTCWSHDNQLRENPALYNASSIAKDNYYQNMLWAVSEGLCYSKDTQLSLGDLFTWTVQHQISHLLPDEILKRLLGVSAPPLHDGPTFTPQSVAMEKAKLALKVDPDPPALYLKNPKRHRWENKNLLQIIKKLPCCACGNPADDAHHIVGYGLSGMGTKAHDWYVIPLCRGHHDELHRDPVKWEQKYGYQLDFHRQCFDRLFGLGVFG